MTNKQTTSRSRQDDKYTKLVIKACKYIENSKTIPTLDELSKHCHLSSYHLHRIFKSTTGVTPRAYANAFRNKRIRENLLGKQSISQAIFDAGFNSNSRFYEQSNKDLGMTPTRFRAGGKDEEIIFAVGECSLGSILVASSKKGICSISLGDDPEKLIHELEDCFPNAIFNGSNKKYEETVATVIGFIEQPRIDLKLPLDIQGTAFQQRVWQALREIPAGETKSYTEIARHIGAPKSVRAVAKACAANKIAIAIPCHRVIRNDGNLSGYRWGIERKKKLLKRESRKK